MSHHKHKHTRVGYRLLLACVALACILIINARGQTTQFTYQGRLTDSGNLADGLYDMQFKLFDAAAVGTGVQLGPTITRSTVHVENGAFAVELDFTPCIDCFDGSARFLEVKANTTACCSSFFGTDSGHDNTDGQSNSFFGFSTGRFNVSGSYNSFFGRDAGFATLSDRNAFLGAFAGDSNTTGNNNTVIGADADVGANNLSFATAIGAGSVVGNSNSVVLGRASDTVRIPGSLVVSTLGAATATQLCISAGLISNCSSSLRHKDRLAPFTPGLDLISKLRPITFNWKQSGGRDLGLAAEEVAELEPMLVTRDERGQVEGVKYDRITVALVDAIREQQAQIALLEKIVCLDHPGQEFCKPAK